MDQYHKKLLLEEEANAELIVHSNLTDVKIAELTEALWKSNFAKCDKETQTLDESEKGLEDARIKTEIIEIE